MKALAIVCALAGIARAEGVERAAGWLAEDEKLAAELPRVVSALRHGYTTEGGRFTRCY